MYVTGYIVTPIKLYDRVRSNFETLCMRGLFSHRYEIKHSKWMIFISTGAEIVKNSHHYSRWQKLMIIVLPVAVKTSIQKMKQPRWLNNRLFYDKSFLRRLKSRDAFDSMQRSRCAGTGDPTKGGNFCSLPKRRCFIRFASLLRSRRSTLSYSFALAAIIAPGKASQPPSLIDLLVLSMKHIQSKRGGERVPRTTFL